MHEHDDPHGNAMPINRVNFAGKVLAFYPGFKLAARGEGRCERALKRALEHGTSLGGFWYRYADTPANCQPLQRVDMTAPKPVPKTKPKYRQPVTINEITYPDRWAAAEAMGLKYTTLVERMRRKRDRAWRGSQDVAMATTG